MIFLIIIFVNIFGVTFGSSSDITNLIGEPDYRKVRLHWETNLESEESYNVRYCELQSWGAHRCRVQSVPQPENNLIDHDEKVRMFTTDINGLRMATTYSFEVRTVRETGERENRAEGNDKNQNIIVIPTKGFSAKATQCLPHASEIEVSTGPYFGGRIAVEATDGERCALDGDPQSPRDTYTLRISHTECGSQVNETTVATFVIVQENLPILTHSTRRFLVLCSYQPETLTVRAGINLPTGKGQVQRATPAASVSSYEDNYLGRRGRNIRTGRLLLKPEALVKEQKPIEEKRASSAVSTINVIPIFVLTMLGLALLIVLIALILKFSSKRIQALDNISISSQMSISSCTTLDESTSGICESETNNINSRKFVIIG